jgi:hypothetical protein
LPFRTGSRKGRSSQRCEDNKCGSHGWCLDEWRDAA